MLNLRRRHIHKTRPIRGHIQPRNVPDNLPPLMPDGESILQHCNLAGKAGKRRHRKHRDDRQPTRLGTNNFMPDLLTLEAHA